MASEASTFVVKDEDLKIRSRKNNKNALLIDRDSFFNDLLKFHESRGTPIVKFPKIAGNGNMSDVDLYKLYEIVTGKGGWMKVNSKNEWDEVEKEIGFPEKCVNSELALKHIYLRFFDKYERYNFLGEEKERIDEDEDENRHKRWSARTLHSIPQSYNHSVHNVSESVRINNKLSTDLYQASEYDKLVMSLLSPLPNDQDFAVNVLTLMSNECKQTLRLGKCPRLISILLAHAGVFEHFNLRDMFREFYAKLRGHSQDQFWKDLLVEKPDLLDLLFEDCLSDEDVFLDGTKLKELLGNNQGVLDVKEYSFLALGRGLGTQDYIGQRVHQVASILRNLSFFEENISILCHNRSLMRFLIMSSNIRWSNLHHMALDVLGNIASEIELKDPFADTVSRHLFGTIIDGIESRDRGVIISSMEILSKLCSVEANEEFLLKYLEKKNYEQVCCYLLVQDMMLLIYTLECVYSLTSLGEKACNSIVEIHGMMDVIVSMVTLEAQSLGPDSCIQMKVVETIPTRMLAPNRMMPPAPIAQKGNIPEQQKTIYQSPTKFVQPSMESPSRADQLVKQNQQQLIQENEQFALAWIRNNFELSQSLMVKIDEQDMYRMYVNACTKVGRKGVLSFMHFPRCVRSVFGGNIGPNPGNAVANSNEKPQQYYCGIKPRASIQQQESAAPKTEMIVIHPPKSASPAHQQVKNEDSVLVAQLSGKQATSTTGTTSLLQQVLSTNQHATSTQSSAVSSATQQVATANTSTTSLIKSLLANKVTTASSEINNTPTATVSMSPSCVVSPNVKSLHQVAQRQFTAKQKQLSEQLNAPSIPPPPPSGNPATKNLIVTGNAPSLTNLKIGQSTISIKPGTLPSNTVITTSNPNEKQVVVSSNDPPPLAPLSIQSNKTGATKVIMTPSSQKITANKMLVDLLDKKALEPPAFATGVKRKIDMDISDVPSKRSESESSSDAATPSSKAAGEFAKLVGSIFEDEEMEDEIEKSVPAKIIEKKIIEVKPSGGQQIINSAPRQIIMGPNNQVLLSPSATSGTHHTTATIKTDSGIQTVPIILQNNSIQGIPTQTLMPQQQQPTQYILATNQQGQTYVVAQTPQPPMPQTVLLAQSPHQQGHQTKTIIILQQPGQQNSSSMQPQNQQKIIMTPSGQQVIYSTQRPFVQQQIIHPMVSQSGNILTNTTIIQSSTTQSMSNRKIVITNAHDGASSPCGAKIIQTVQQAHGSAKIVNQTMQQTSQQTIQALTQGQNILVQKGQKFQIGNTQISQVMQPAVTQQTLIHNQQTQILQKTIQKEAHCNVVASRESTPIPSGLTVKMIETAGAEPSTVVHQSEKEQVEREKPVEMKTDEVSTPKESPNASTLSGTASPAPSKQTISIQIPVPQSQLAGVNSQQHTIKIIPSMDPSKVKDEDVDPSWPYVCDWRGCPKKKFASANEVYLHACAIHCPHVDGNPDIFCQWGAGSTLCDNLPRKRFSLMTHIFDRHCTVDAFKAGVQKRHLAIENGTPAPPKQPYPVTLIRQPNNPQPDNQNINLTNGPTNIQNAGAAAMQAIKRHSSELNIAKERMEDPEGTVTKSIRLTAALILRNLTTYSTSAKRALRYHESHLAQIALSNYESNRVVAQVLFEMNDHDYV